MPTINYSALEELEIELTKLLKKVITLSLVIACTGTTILLISMGSFSKIYENIIPLLILFIFLFVIPLFLIQITFGNIIRSEAFKKFSQNNGFVFTKSPKNELRHAHFLSYGNSQKYSFCIESPNTQPPFSFFNFKYGVTSRNAKGRNTTTWYPFTVLAIQLPKNVPNIYIHNKSNNSISEPFTEDQRLALNIDMDFERTHSTYAPKQYEIEALQILDAPFVQKLSQTVHGGDVELHDSKLFIYLPQEEFTEEITSVKKLFEIYESLYQPIIEKMNSFSYAQIGNSSPLLKKDTLEFFNANRNTLGILLNPKIIIGIIILILIAIKLLRENILPLLQS